MKFLIPFPQFPASVLWYNHVGHIVWLNQCSFSLWLDKYCVMLSEEVDYNFIFSSTFFLEFMVVSFLFAFLLCSYDKFVPKAPVAFYNILLFFSTWSDMSVHLIVLGSSSFFSVTINCVTCWWQAWFFWGFLCCSPGLHLRPSGFLRKCMGTTFLILCVWKCLCSTYVLEWLLELIFFQSFKDTLIVFKCPVFLWVG